MDRNTTRMQFLRAQNLDWQPDKLIFDFKCVLWALFLTFRSVENTSHVVARYETCILWFHACARPEMQTVSLNVVNRKTQTKYAWMLLNDCSIIYNLFHGYTTHSTITCIVPVNDNRAVLPVVWISENRISRGNSIKNNTGGDAAHGNSRIKHKQKWRRWRSKVNNCRLFRWISRVIVSFVL